MDKEVEEQRTVEDSVAPTVGIEGPTRTLAMKMDRNRLIHNSKVEAISHT